jgi:DNA repair protein RecN (Recombination protein N)
MLKELYIKNFALIEEITVRFDPRLTVLSGETGAGKSIIVGALGLVLGDAGKTSFIRSGTGTCIVEGRIEVGDDHPVRELLAGRGVELGAGEDLVVRRIISTAGSSKSFVNGLQVSAKDLQEITDLLVDVHGQHEHQSLLNVKNHLSLLDRYGKLQDEARRYQDSYKRTMELKKEIERLTMDEREKERRIDILRYSVGEIENARLVDGEDGELQTQYEVLKNYEQLASAVTAAYALLKLNDSSAVISLADALQELSKARSVSQDIERLCADLEGAKLVVDDAASGLRRFIDGIEYEPGKIDGVIARLELIKGLKKKYGASLAEVRAYGEKCKKELDTLIMNEDVIKGLDAKLKDEIQRAGRYAVELSARRRVEAKALEESVKKELSYLSMGKANFKVGISYRGSETGAVKIDGKLYELGASGLDQVEFLISPNPGEPLLPLKSIASGGELSRIMLAIKTVLGNVDPISTFVFDEIDAGIGGKVAWAVGTRLRDLSRLKQILCVTHQPQIASRGDLNIRVEKVSKEQRTVTQVKLLERKEKIEEIARMISGKEISEAALRQASEMIGER